MQELTLVFRNGHKTTYKAENFTLTKSVIDGGLTGLKWDNIQGPQPMWIDMTEVVLAEIAEADR